MMDLTNRKDDLMSYYPAIIQQSSLNHEEFEVTFPDFTGKVEGKDLREVKQKTTSYVRYRLRDLKDKGIEVPTPTPLSKIKDLDKNSMIIMISVD